MRAVADEFIRVLREHGIAVTVTSTRRSLDTQRQLWHNWINGCSRYPAARPGKSTHALGIAFDLQLDPPMYDAAGQLWESIGGTWGGRFGDEIHFEIPQ